MTKTQVTLAAAAVLGSLALGAGSVSAAPAAAGLSVGGAPTTWVMMHRHKKMMMHKKMMHRKMMRRKMMMKDKM